MLTYPHINPIALQIGPLSIHWYGVMYLVAFSAAWILARYRAAQPGSTWSARAVDDFIFYAMLGTIVGGRVGYVLFYGQAMWRADLWYPLKLWEGGMSFHGGFLGVLAAVALFARQGGRRVWDVADFAAPLPGIVRAGGNSNLDDLYVIFKDNDPRPATAVAQELDNLRTPEATALLVRLLKRPHVAVQLAAARALIHRGARDTFASLKPFLDAKADADLRGLALVSAEPSTLDNLAKLVDASETADAKLTRLALSTYHARLARAERAPAGDLLVGAIGKLPPADQANAMVDWLAANAAATAAAAATSTTAAAVPAKR